MRGLSARSSDSGRGAGIERRDAFPADSERHPTETGLMQIHPRWEARLLDERVRYAVVVAAIALGVTGCGGRGSAGRSAGYFTAQQVRRAFAAHPFPLIRDQRLLQPRADPPRLYFQWASPPGGIINGTRGSVRLVRSRFPLVACCRSRSRQPRGEAHFSAQPPSGATERQRRRNRPPASPRQGLAPLDGRF